MIMVIKPCIPAQECTEVLSSLEDLMEHSLKVGDRIWRSVGYNIYTGIHFDEITFDKTDKGFMFRANKGAGLFTKEWVVCGCSVRGLVCFCNESIPKRWTYFEVINLAKNGKSVTVHPVCGSAKELAEQYDFKDLRLFRKR